MANRTSMENDFRAKFYGDIMPKIYGIGAAVVIAGAMFKLLNWPGGALMLGLGLTTEAVIFLLSAFEPKAKEVDWTIVYPELGESSSPHTSALTMRSNQGPVGEKLDELFAHAKIDSALIERLGQGMEHLSKSVATMASSINKLQAAGEETEKFQTELAQLSQRVASLKKVYGNMLTALKN